MTQHLVWVCNVRQIGQTANLEKEKENARTHTFSCNRCQMQTCLHWKSRMCSQGGSYVYFWVLMCSLSYAKFNKLYCLKQKAKIDKNLTFYIPTKKLKAHQSSHNKKIICSIRAGKIHLPARHGECPMLQDEKKIWLFPGREEILRIFHPCSMFTSGFAHVESGSQ